MPAAYRLSILPSAAKEIRGIGSGKDRERITRRIAALAGDPRPPGCTKLAGREAYRIRQRDFRILYSVRDDVLVVEVVKVGHRSDVYR